MIQKNGGENSPPECGSAAARTAAASRRGEARCQFEACSLRGCDEINVNRFCLTEEVFFNDKFCSLFVNHFIVVFRLVQSHAQRGPGSTDGHGDADGRISAFVLEKIL
ncbi:MAG TPA: hypothetical protein PK927_11680, partial [Smithellaceae bacterium]|nr:hypothetical protein [Smithellaceae bacterium]